MKLSLIFVSKLFSLVYLRSFQLFSCICLFHLCSNLTITFVCSSSCFVYVLWNGRSTLCLRPRKGKSSSGHCLVLGPLPNKDLGCFGFCDLFNPNTETKTETSSFLNLIPKLWLRVEVLLIRYCDLGQEWVFVNYDTEAKSLNTKMRPKPSLITLKYSSHCGAEIKY